MAKKATPKTKKPVKNPLPLTTGAAYDREVDTSTALPVPTQPKRPQYVKIGLVVAVLVAAGFILSRNKGLLAAAIVNGAPIPKWELNQRLSSRFGEQMLEALIGERLILDEAQKQNVIISEAQIDGRMSQIEADLSGSMGLEQSLKLQGITLADFKNQIKLQLLVDAMLSANASVSAEEVNAYIKTKADTLTASTAAEKQTEAAEAIKQQKVTQAFPEWFNKLKESAKIERFL